MKYSKQQTSLHPAVLNSYFDENKGGSAEWKTQESNALLSWA